jgi:UDP-N-acetylmuramyl pentapeptide synthase
MRQLMYTILRLMARAVLVRQRPVVIGVTGSMGKTTTVRALTTIFAHKYPNRARGTENIVRNEISVPLAIIGCTHAPGRSFVRWLALVVRWMWTVTFSWHYPRVLVLEFGVDRPGDMDYLTQLAPPQIGVMTWIASVHTEYLGDIRGVAWEKGKLITALPSDGLAVLNGDDARVAAMASKSRANVLTYGIGDDAQDRVDVWVSNIRAGGMDGVSFKVNYDGNSVPIRLSHIISPHMLTPVVAAITVALGRGMHLVEIAEALEDFAPSAGRMRLLAGINDSMIIDDTYNAPLDAMRAAITATATMPAMRTIAVLGDILELGSQEMAIHKSLADDVLAAQIHAVITVGRRMEYLHSELLQRGMSPHNLYHVATPMDAGNIARNVIAPQDCVLVKGAQKMRMEKVVAQILDDAHDASELLCRQDNMWRDRPFVQP